MTIMTAIKKPAFYATLGLLSFSMSGCGMFFGEEGWFRNRGGDYQRADNIAPLKLDENLDKRAMGDLYPIPPIKQSDFDETGLAYDVPRPLPISSNLLEESVKIQRLGSQTWILMNVSPGEVWPRVRSFLNINGLTVNTADISSGVIETDWIQFKTDLTTHDRYRIQIDQGVQPETSEIHILHMSIPNDTKQVAGLSWPATSSNPEREKWLLDELSATLASDVTEGGTSLLAQTIGGSAKAGLVTVRNEPVLNLRLDRARALGTLAHAVKQDGFTPYENNSETGIFYVQYRKPDAEGPGWFARKWAGLRNSKVVSAIAGVSEEEQVKISSPYTLEEITQNLPTGDALDNAPYSKRDAEKQLPKAPGYLLLVSGADGDLTVRLRDPYGKRIDPRQARDMLTAIRKNLI